MKHLLAQATILALLSTGVSITSINPVNAGSISNPKCVAGLRGAQSRRAYQAFAMTAGGAHCGWTIHSSSTQSKANRAALDGCKRRAQGQKCYVVWPN